MDNEKFFTILIITIGIFIAISVAFIQSYFEVKTFNKFSGKQASIVDALFADLRIEACRQN